LIDVSDDDSMHQRQSITFKCNKITECFNAPFVIYNKLMAKLLYIGPLIK